MIVLVTLILIQVDKSDALRTCTAWAAIGLKVVPARLTGATSVIPSSSDVSFSWVGGGGGGVVVDFSSLSLLCMCVGMRTRRSYEVWHLPIRIECAFDLDCGLVLIRAGYWDCALVYGVIAIALMLFTGVMSGALPFHASVTTTDR